MNRPLSRIRFELEIIAGRAFARDGLFQRLGSSILISVWLAETSSVRELTPRLFGPQKADGALSMIIHCRKRGRLIYTDGDCMLLNS